MRRVPTLSTTKSRAPTPRRHTAAARDYSFCLSLLRLAPQDLAHLHDAAPPPRHRMPDTWHSEQPERSPQITRCPRTGSASRVNAWLARPGTPDLRKLARSLPATRRLPLHKVTRGKPVQGRWMGENRRPSHRGRRAPGKRSRHWPGSLRLTMPRRILCPSVSPSVGFVLRCKPDVDARQRDEHQRLHDHHDAAE